MRRLRSLFFAAFALAALAPAQAQQPAPAVRAAATSPSVKPPSPAAQENLQLDGARAALDAIRGLIAPGANDQALSDLRTKLDPLTKAVQSAQDELGPKLDAVVARLKELGPKPAAAAPPEAASVSSDREDEQRQFDELDGALKRARLLAVELGQTDAALVAARRSLFAGALFARSSSLVAPDLWLVAAREAPFDARSLATIAQAWGVDAAAALAGGRLAAFLALVAAIAALYPLAQRVRRRVSTRDPAIAEPGPLRKATAAVWVALVTAAVPIVAAAALGATMRGFGLMTRDMEPLAASGFEAVARIAIAIGVARGLLAPGRPNWRLVGLTDATVARLARLALLVAIFVSATKLLETLADVADASLSTAILLRGLGALASALVIASKLRGVAPAPDEDDCLGPRVTPRRDWWGPLRLLVWMAVCVVVAAALVGFVAFAAFVVDQIVWVAFMACGFVLANALAGASIAAGFKPQAPVGRLVVASLAIRRESLDQIGVLLGGCVTLALFTAAVLFALAPWGVESNNMVDSLHAAFFGFAIGGVSVSLASVAVALGLFALALGLARALQRWLDTRLLPTTELDSGLRDAIRTSVGYLGVTFAAVLAAGRLGLDFEKLALVAGALSVGIGFGLQSIISNFVSGLILLWERAIRVGDWVVMGEEQGFVRRINVRSTEIETFDRATMIVPNSNLMTGIVKNWARPDRAGRIKVAIAVNYAVDAELVRGILLDVARAHELAQKVPAPQVLFTAIVDNFLKFELICFVADVETAARVRSDLFFDAHRRLKAAAVDLSNAATPAAAAQPSAVAAR